MEPRSVQLVQQSVGLVADHPVELAEKFYTYLFQLAPETRAMFPSDMTAQTDKLCRALVAAIEGLGTPWSIEPQLRQLGADHLKYGVRAEHYVPVGQALLSAVREIAQGGWESSLGTAWVDVFEYLAEAMQSGAAEAQRFGSISPGPPRTAPTDPPPGVPVPAPSFAWAP